MKLLIASLLFAVLSPDQGQDNTTQAVRPLGAAGDLELSTRTVTLDDGRQVEVEAGTLLVPERRDKDTGQVISIPFYRMACTADEAAAPIFLLAGGPGSSGIDNFEDAGNYEDARYYAGFADVVIFDQRGAGHSLPELACDHSRSLPADEPLDMQRWAEEMCAMAAECRQHWTESGVDLNAYTTVENAADVDALRKALGYERMSLVGGSYGSHLALALMKLHGDSIDRALLYGVEGLDQTWDDPAGRLAAYGRIAAHAEASEELGPHVPKGGLIKALGTVIERLAKKPETVWVQRGDESIEVVIDATLIRMIAGFQAGRRSRANLWPELIMDMHAGDYSFAAQGALALRRLQLDDPMHYMMDCSSGISAERRERYDSDPARSLLGDINFEYAALCTTWKAPDLGPAYRSPLQSDIPTLIVHGNLDTKTPIENAREVVRSLKNGHLIEVQGGHHGALFELYRDWQPAREKIGAFLRGEEVTWPKSVTSISVEYQPR